MGTAANTGRRALIAYVKDCLAQVNTLTAGFTTIREEHNKLVDALEAANKRIDGASAWAAKNEKAVEQADYRVTLLRSEVTAVLTTLTRRERFRLLWSGTLPTRANLAGFVQTQQTESPKPPQPAQALADYRPATLGPRSLP